MVYSSVVAPPMSGPSVSRRPLIKVVVRVRPATGDICWVKQIDERTLQTTNHRNVKEFLQYEFEQVYGPEAGQSLIYEGCAQSLVSSVLDGRNVCIFAYGPTGSGKTHTMLGTVEDPGIIPMCVQEFFTALREWDRTYQLRFSYLEIYNEKVRDLLQPPHSSVDLPIREDHHHNIFVAGLSERSVDNMDQFNDAFTPAAKNRRTAATSLNKRSSRSHALLMLKVLRVMPSGGTAVVGKMNLIDLAGSEDNRRTGNAGIRLKESSAINTSLLALGQVVEALRKGQSCVPYRASKLTRLLQDSLGGVTQTCMIITVSPEQCHFQETHTTLGFARKAKKIVTSAKLPERREVFTPCCPKREEVSADVIKPVPFLSPLLREQRKFEGALCKRLERLEQRLLEQMSQSVVNQSVVSVVSTDTRVDRNVNDTLDTTYAVEKSDVTDQNLSSSTCDNEVNGDRSVTLKTPFRLDLSHYSSDISSGDVTLLSDRNFPETPIMDTSENSFGNSCHDYSHMTSGNINFGRGCNDDELKPFSPGGAAAIDYTGFGTATTKLSTVITEIKSCKRRNHDASLLSTTVSSSSVKMHKLKRKSVFADGSSRLDNFLSVDEVLSCSPLFLKPPLVKRWRHAPFVSTAVPRANVTTVPRDRSPLQPINGSYLVNENTKDAQKEHNYHVLHVLNAGSLKELQSLQTIGQKRAQQIMNWRTLQGRFHKISDLKKVPGISINKFLSANLIED